MINLTNNKDELKLIFNEEKVFLQDYLKSQQKLNTDLHIILKATVNESVIVNSTQSQNFVDNLSDFLKVLKKSSSNICNVEKLLKRLHSLKLSSEDSLEKYNCLYSKLFSEIVKNTVIIENFIKINKSAKSAKSTNRDLKEDVCPNNNAYFENTLLVSEIDNKVVLPYTIEALNKELATNPDKYKCLEDIINTVYTKPLKYYDNSSLMRFKEAFKLVREREHGSFYQALDLAFELFSNYNLHPAVITACKNMKELDVYLSCLEYNELDDFHFFKTVFKYRPSKLKTSKT